MKYSFNEVNQLIRSLSKIFDVVRLVNPEKCQEIVLEDNKRVCCTKKCYRVWKKEKRCENCISFQANRTKKRMSKFELLDQDIFYVLVSPLELHLPDHAAYPCVLELVVKNSNKLLLGAFGQDRFMENVVTYEKKLYEDSLTKAYNRRYFDERVFCYNICEEKPREMVFVLADLKDFKQINDMYGHPIGDSILFHAVQLIKKTIRKEDAIIRIGGDEFLVVMQDCNSKAAKQIIEAIREQFKRELTYDIQQNKFAVMNFGISYMAQFDGSDQSIHELYTEADRKMYVEKKTTCM